MGSDDEECSACAVFLERVQDFAGVRGRCVVDCEGDERFGFGG